MAIELSHTHTPHGHARLMGFGGAAIPPFFLLGCRDLLAIAPGLGLENGLWLLRRGLFLLFAGKFLLNNPPWLEFICSFVRYEFPKVYFLPNSFVISSKQCLNPLSENMPYSLAKSNGVYVYHKTRNFWSELIAIRDLFIASKRCFAA